MQKTVPFSLRAPVTASEIEKRRYLREAIAANPYLILHAMALGNESANSDGDHDGDRDVAQLDLDESGPGHCARHHALPTELHQAPKLRADEILDEPRPARKTYLTPIDHEDFC